MLTTHTTRTCNGAQTGLLQLLSLQEHRSLYTGLAIEQASVTVTGAGGFEFNSSSSLCREHQQEQLMQVTLTRVMLTIQAVMTTRLCNRKKAATINTVTIAPGATTVHHTGLRH
jgi:hypothetical protein